MNKWGWIADWFKWLVNGMGEGKDIYDVPQREILYAMALSFLGTDVSEKIAGRDRVVDAVACAETVTDIVGMVRPEIKWTNRFSTYYCRRDLFDGKSFAEVKRPERGDIVLSATGYGGRNGITNGHMGIVLANGIIASNDSRSGLFDANYTVESWRRYFVERGGYEMLFFRLL